MSSAGLLGSLASLSFTKLLLVGGGDGDLVSAN